MGVIQSLMRSLVLSIDGIVDEAQVLYVSGLLKLHVLFDKKDIQGPLKSVEIRKKAVYIYSAIRCFVDKVESGTKYCSILGTYTFLSYKECRP